jgi:hypothetical protein
LPAGVKSIQVNYDDESSLVSALKDQQFLVITLSARAPPDTHSKIVQAAAKAGVPYVMPNAYGSDMMNSALRKEDLYSEGCWERCREIERLGSAYVTMVCGFWYEWSLALGENFFGIDIKNRKATFFDDGKTPVSTSTWRQCGRALAALLSLPETDSEPAVEQWKNKAFYIASFTVSQRDMLDSVHRVIGTTDKDWEIRYEPSAQRYQDGLEAMQQGDMTGFAKSMYTRIFYPNGDGDFEKARGLANGVIGIPKDNLDDATKRAVDLAESGWNPMSG